MYIPLVLRASWCPNVTKATTALVFALVYGTAYVPAKEYPNDDIPTTTNTGGVFLRIDAHVSSKPLLVVKLL